jgi:2-polyprenyl-3-methyl-5-hydroxy-6-metoxy-1,4-benzoquinol methylase
VTAAEDDAFWLHDADPAVDICDPTLTVGACLDAILPTLAEHVPLEQARIVEFGCGVGRLTNPVQARYPDARVVGVDISARFLDIAATEAARLGVNPTYILSANVGLAAIPEAQGCDAVYTMCVLQHLDGDRKRGLLHQAGRVLRPGGVLRAQYVEGDHSSRCMYDARLPDVLRWCGEAGLRVTEYRHHLLMDRWTWITAVRPT